MDILLGPPLENSLFEANLIARWGTADGKGRKL